MPHLKAKEIETLFLQVSPYEYFLAVLDEKYIDEKYILFALMLLFPLQ